MGKWIWRFGHERQGHVGESDPEQVRIIGGRVEEYCNFLAEEGCGEE